MKLCDIPAGTWFKIVKYPGTYMRTNLTEWVLDRTGSKKSVMCVHEDGSCCYVVDLDVQIKLADRT
jgi:hypothetical protein